MKTADTPEGQLALHPASATPGGARADDAHVLMAMLHRQALFICHRAAGETFNGLDMAAKGLGLAPTWRRRLRQWDCCLGLVEKISMQTITKHLALLEAEIARAQTGREGDAAGGEMQARKVMEAGKPAGGRVLRKQSSEPEREPAQAAHGGGVQTPQEDLVQQLHAQSLKQESKTKALETGMSKMCESFSEVHSEIAKVCLETSKMAERITAVEIAVVSSDLKQKVGEVEAKLVEVLEKFDKWKEDENEDKENESGCGNDSSGSSEAASEDPVPAAVMVELVALAAKVQAVSERCEHLEARLEEADDSSDEESEDSDNGHAANWETVHLRKWKQLTEAERTQLLAQGSTEASWDRD